MPQLTMIVDEGLLVGDVIAVIEEGLLIPTNPHSLTLVQEQKSYDIFSHDSSWHQHVVNNNNNYYC